MCGNNNGLVEGEGCLIGAEEVGMEQLAGRWMLFAVFYLLDKGAFIRFAV